MLKSNTDHLRSLLSCALFAVLLLTGCGETGAGADVTWEDPRFSYQLENVIAYALDGEDILAAFEGQSTLSRYNAKGERTEELELGEGYHTNLISREKEILTFSYTDNGPSLTEYDKESGIVTAHSLPGDITSVMSMAATDDDIYFIYWSDTHDEAQDFETEDYTYMGERVVVVPRDTYEPREMGLLNPVGLYQTSDSEIMFYAYDLDQGYYFVPYDCENDQFGEKIYNSSFGYLFGFAIDREENAIFATDFSRQALFTAQLEGKAQTDLANQLVALSGNDMKYQDGCCYVLDRLSGDVVRIDCEQADHGNEEIVFYQTVLREEPFGCGYQIRTEILEEDEFALSVLACDEDYDLCMMSSVEEQAAEVRNRGAFYPLNDVPGVEEYLDACHPYIREAATDENGDIWMLPIAVDLPFLLYNGENCAQYGVDAEEITDYGKLLEAADVLYQNPEAREWYSINGYQVQSALINQYNECFVVREQEANYDTPEFENLCRLMREYDIGGAESLHTWMTNLSVYAGEEAVYYGNWVIALEHYYDVSAYDEEMFVALRARALPAVSEDDGAHVGTCIYFSVNPNSANLDATLNYISAYSSYMMGRKDTFLFQDEELCPNPDSPLSADLYGIYADGAITFAFPEEIFFEDYKRYQDGAIGFSELAEELERKVNMYLHE